MIKKIIISFCLFIFVLGVGELFLRQKYKPGFQNNYWGFNIVDSLIVYQDYETDKFGNYVISKLVRDSIQKELKCINANNKHYNNIANTDGILRVLNDFCELRKNNPKTFPFEKFIDFTQYIKVPDEVENAYLQYLYFPINSDGFRSIPFKNHHTNKKKVFLVGDSFHWGMTAKPIYNSYADLLSAKGYAIYNAGIVSVDIIQYYSIIKSYVDSIKPDLVIVSFYEGNDYLSSLRKHGQNYPHEYITNAGFFESSPQGKFLSAQEAYEFYKSTYVIPNTNWYDRLMAKTSIGSILWKYMFKNRYQQLQYSTPLNQEESKYNTMLYIDSIGNFLKEKNISYLFTAIPECKLDSTLHTSIYADTARLNTVFVNEKYSTPYNLKASDYNNPQDFHFNNSGSEKFALFLDSLIQVNFSKTE